MPISVIVSNFNGAKYLPRLIETLKAQRGVEVEMIVVDRNSTDQSDSILARHHDVKVIKECPETGLVAGYSAGVAHARFNSLFFCNEDMWFAPDCLARLESLISMENMVGAAMPLQLTYDGAKPVNSGIWFRSCRWARANPYPFRESLGAALTAPVFLSGINAGACLIDRRAYDEVGGWDKSFFLDYEDMDLSLRFWQLGWKCMIDPAAVVYHDVGASNEKTIDYGRTVVGHKRYVCAFSNQLVISLKTFTGAAASICPILLWLDRVFHDLLSFRFRNVKLDCAAGWLTLRRLPALLRYRREHKNTNRHRPGQRWFTDPKFDISTTHTRR